VFVLPILFTLSCSTGPAVDSAPAQPNVIVFTLDTLRADALGAYGHRAKPSPNIDALTATGYRFTRAYTVTPLTIPAHSSLWTSLWPPRHGVQDNGDFFLDEGAVTLAEQLQGAGYQTMASVGAEVTSHHWGFAQGFDAYFDDMGESRAEEKNRWRVERPATEVIDDALGWFASERNADKPYFAWMHFFDIHHPYVPPEPYKTQFADRPYLGEIAWTDAQVQGFLDKLTAMGALENTWLFILSDHGEGRGSHGENLHGTLLYNATTRIPFIVVPPTRDGGGQRVDFPASIVDVYPTVLKLAGLPTPEDLDGIDLTPWLKPAEAAAEPLKGRSVYVESLYAYRHYGWAPQKAWVTDTHKLIESTTPEIYDAWDIPETENLAATAPEVLSAHRTELLAKTEAMVTVDAAAGRAELSEERLEQLAALGYITTTVDEDQPTDNLPDPVAKLPLLREVEKARSLLQSGLVEEASAQVDQILAEEPSFVDMRAMKTQLLLRSGDLEGAYAAARALDEDHPSTSHKSLLANILLRRGNSAEAARVFESIVEIDPYLGDAWSGLLTSLFLAGQIPQLDAATQRAQAVVPNHPATRTFTGIVHVMKNEMEPAEQILMAVLADNPNQPFVNHSLGLMRRAEGNADAAEQFLVEEIRLHPPAIPARRTLVEMLAEQRRYSEQLVQLDAIAEIEVPNPMTMHSRGQALFNLGKMDEAAEITETCLNADRKYPGCWMLWANILSKQGKQTEAKTAYDKAVSLAARHPGRRPKVRGKPKR
jgi:arylsulfatase A-like enzyme/Flp pilus assembly protein TadD